MSLKEQKLFFTRNGEFTVWEKLNALTLPLLEDLYYYILDKGVIDGRSYPVDEEFPSFLYRAFESLNESQNKEQFEVKINEAFSYTDTPRSDFNALIYHFPVKMLDFLSAKYNIEELKSTKHQKFEIQGLEIDSWYYEERNIIDIRFTSEKNSYFKENNNIQYLHTEIRVYLNLNVALLTNFTQYTHSDTDKSKFMSAVLSKVAFVGNGVIQPINLSDHTLRKLIVMEDQNLPAKLKFHVEGRFKVDIDINHDANVRDLISQEEIKYFYDKYPLSVIRVKIRDDAEKLISLDGTTGKMFSRSLNLEPEDIDDFIEKISILLSYDYLNVNYRKEIGRLAYYNMMGSDQQKDNVVSSIYKDIESYIYTETQDITGVFVKLISNSFFYCLKEKIILDQLDVTKSNEILRNLDSRMVSYLQRITKVQSSEIGATLNKLLELYNQNKDDVTKLTIAIHESIRNITELIPNASGQ